jgi:hypothetical protein
MGVPNSGPIRPWELWVTLAIFLLVPVLAIIIPVIGVYVGYLH